MTPIKSIGLGALVPALSRRFCAIDRVDPASGVRPMLPYVLKPLAGTLVVAAVPWLSIGVLAR